MNVQFFHPDGDQVFFQQVDNKKYRGTLLPGSEVEQSSSWASVVTVQEFQNPLFCIGHRLLEIFSKIRFTINDIAGLRFEALLSGEMNISVNGEKKKFRTGEYRITDVPLFKALFRKNTSCSIFVSHYSEELLSRLGFEITSCAPQRMPFRMSNLINEMLHNSYTEDLRNFYYENCVRELLFMHLAHGTETLPGEVGDKDIALIYKADSIIGSNLQQHHTIDELARMINSNSLKLKTGFNKVFGMGVFGRLLFRRMEEAKILLETTDKPINEVANLAGYNSTAAFIHAFRKKFGLTPREWRLQEKNADGGEGE